MARIDWLTVAAFLPSLLIIVGGVIYDLSRRGTDHPTPERLRQLAIERETNPALDPQRRIKEQLQRLQ